MASSIYAQDKLLIGIINNKHDTNFWYKLVLSESKEISLGQLQLKNDNKVYYRIWLNMQIIEIETCQECKPTCRVINYTNELVPNGEPPTDRYFVKIDTIGIDTSRNIYELITSSGVFSLPSEDLITGWKQGFDGVTYILEYSNKESYSIKTYWTPTAQGSLKEALGVQKFINEIESIVDLKDHWNRFTKIIPFQCYSLGAPLGCCKGLTKKQSKEYLYERNNYRQQRASKSKWK